LLAARRRPRFASLTLAATNLFTDTPIPGPLALARLPLVGEVLFAAMFSRPGLAALWRGATGDRAAFPYRRFARLHDHPGGLRSARDLFLRSLRDLPGLYGPVATAASGLGLPAQVLWGDRDPLFSLDVARRTAGHLGATLRVAAGAGHFLPEERPAWFADAVLEHARSHA
jgi:pimeloyl-ACP methyl ester carboxylesterase